MKSKINSKEVGLDLGLLLFKNFLDTDYLHYGLFKNGLEPKTINLPKAQENYAQLLISLIPDNVNTILDIGGGSGRFALTLANLGYKVDCVTPDSVLTDYAEELLGNQVDLYKMTFQKFETESKYDMIIFSESFQYIPIKVSMEKSIRLLNKGGHILIADFFKTDTKGKSALGGGHKLKTLNQKMNDYPISLEISKDITFETAPTIDIANQLSKNLLHPIWRLILDSLSRRYPKLYKLLKWKYSKKINKIEHTYFSGEMNGENFKKFKCYMVYLLKLK